MKRLFIIFILIFTILLKISLTFNTRLGITLSHYSLFDCNWTKEYGGGIDKHSNK